MANGQPIRINFTGGMNNVDTTLDLFLRGLGETSSLINADTTYGSKLKLLRPLAAIISAIGTEIHTIYRAQDWIFLGAGTVLYYLNYSGNSATSLITGLSGNPISMQGVGDWVFLAGGTNRKAIYIGGSTPEESQWGEDPPDTAPTVAVGAAGNPNDTYSCYYRHKITLADGVTIVRTALSPVGTVTVASEKIEWSAIAQSSFTGADTIETELFRTATGWAGKYLVTTLDEGTTTYSDDIADATLQANTAFDETGYYPPPDNPDAVIYHPDADRLFIIVNGDVYWTEAGIYHIVLYDEDADEYSNINSVFLSGENITAAVLIDEQLYFGSNKTWRRLRGKNPTYWEWESTSAQNGPLSLRAFAITAFGAIYPAKDGYFHLFQGIDNKKITEHFEFDTQPDASCWAAFTGRFLHFFYGDTSYPEIVIDFKDWPSKPLRIVKSSRDYSAIYFNKENNILYAGDSDGYLRSGADTDEDVTMSFQTAELPVERLVDLGDAGSLLVDANTQGDNLTITPIMDDESQDSLTPVVLTSRQRDPVSISLNTYRAISFLVSITSKEDIEIRQPWFLRKGDDD